MEGVREEERRDLVDLRQARPDLALVEASAPLADLDESVERDAVVAGRPRPARILAVRDDLRRGVRARAARLGQVDVDEVVEGDRGAAR